GVGARAVEVPGELGDPQAVVTLADRDRLGLGTPDAQLDRAEHPDVAVEDPLDPGRPDLAVAPAPHLAGCAELDDEVVEQGLARHTSHPKSLELNDQTHRVTTGLSVRGRPRHRQGS